MLARSLLNFDLPPVLSEDKLLFRKIFREIKISHDEQMKKLKQRPVINAFETYTLVQSENSGPKVLYITAKSQDGKDKDSDVLKDIEGHPIEKIQTSKLSEKALQEKWKQEEEELEKVRNAK